MSIYLYIKTHQKTGLKYFGKTIKDPYKYKGSGKYWLKHLKKHGNHVDTEVLGCYEENEVTTVALTFSRDNDIINSDEWANLTEENGLDGAVRGKKHSIESIEKMRKSSTGKKHSAATKAKMSEIHKTRKRKPLSEETKAKISIALQGNSRNKGKPKSEEHKAKLSAAKKGKTLSEETKAKMRKSSTGKKHSAATKAKMSASHKARNQKGNSNDR